MMLQGKVLKVVIKSVITSQHSKIKKINQKDGFSYLMGVPRGAGQSLEQVLLSARMRHLNDKDEPFNLFLILSLFLYISPYFSLLINLSAYERIKLSSYLPIYLSTYHPIFLSSYLPIILSSYVPISLSTYLPINIVIGQ